MSLRISRMEAIILVTWVVRACGLRTVRHGVGEESIVELLSVSLCFLLAMIVLGLVYGEGCLRELLGRFTVKDGNGNDNASFSLRS